MGLFDDFSRAVSGGRQGENILDRLKHGGSLAKHNTKKLFDKGGSFKAAKGKKGGDGGSSAHAKQRAKFAKDLGIAKVSDETRDDLLRRTADTGDLRRNNANLSAAAEELNQIGTLGSSLFRRENLRFRSQTVKDQPGRKGLLLGGQ